MSVQHYDRFLFRADPGSREDVILQNGVFERRPKADHFERILVIDCTVEDAKLLLDLAKRVYSPIVPDIEKAIAAAHDC